MRSNSQDNNSNAQGTPRSVESKEESKQHQEEDIRDQQKAPAQDKKIKAPTGPRPTQPRKAADIRDDEDDDDSDGNASDSNRKESRPLASTEIDELRSGSLMVNLDDSDDDGGEVDFKVFSSLLSFVVSLSLSIFIRLKKEDMQVMTNLRIMMVQDHVLHVHQLNHNQKVKEVVIPMLLPRQIHVIQTQIKVQQKIQIL